MNDYRQLQAERRKQERIKRAKRKNMIIYIETFIIVLLSVALVVLSVKYTGLKSDGNGASSALPGSDVSQSGDLTDGSSVLENGSADSSSDIAAANRAELEQWYMKLVNPDNSVTSEFIDSVKLTEITKEFTSGAQSSKYLDSRVVEAFENMCRAAKKDNVTIISVSAYRTYSYQQGLYNRRVERFQTENGLSLDAAKKKAATMVAIPGTSEHHLGLAVDINYVEESFENTAAFRWLQNNAADYGFIMRYPKDKQEITKIIYEPWHYRYVGVEHAKEINRLGMCFEEYVDYLSGKKQ